MASRRSSPVLVNSMNQPERLPVLAFIAACLGVFFVLYLILGGEDSAIGVEVETSDELLVDDDFLDEEDTPIYKQRRSTRSTPRVNNSFSSSFEAPSINTVETPKREIKEWPKWVKRHMRKNKKLSIEQRKAILRKRLKTQGFKNQKYINLRVLDLDRRSFDSARSEAEMLIESGNIDQALKLLQEELDATQEENLLVRSEILSLKMKIAMSHGYATLANNILHQQVRLIKEINSIKKNTILVNNPNARAIMENTDKELNEYEKRKEASKNVLNGLKENNELIKVMKDSIKKSLVSYMYNNSDIPAEEIQAHFKTFEKRIEKGWANPK